ncbi:MAG: putative addiction module antidote protein [Pseudomonas sp.]
MTTTKTRRWDVVEHLKTEEDIALYLEACFEEAGDDAAFIAAALGDVARARGMTQLAKATGMGREGLYKALSGEGNPSFGTILKVMHALGLKLQPQTIAHV